MRTETTSDGKHKVTFYDSIHELPIRRYQKFNKHMMVDLQVGSSVADYDKRTARALGYLQGKDIDNAIVELTNQRQALHHALEGYSPAFIALALMVYSIDNVVCESYQETDLNDILDRLDKMGFTKSEADSNIEVIKKK